jgi:hypothetical protein
VADNHQVNVILLLSHFDYKLEVREKERIGRKRKKTRGEINRLDY